MFFFHCTLEILSFLNLCLLLLFFVYNLCKQNYLNEVAQTYIVKVFQNFNINIKKYIEIDIVDVFATGIVCNHMLV